MHERLTCTRQAQPVPRKLNDMDELRLQFVTIGQRCSLHPKLTSPVGRYCVAGVCGAGIEAENLDARHCNE